jgi:hypothetical protein
MPPACPEVELDSNRRWNLARVGIASRQERMPAMFGNEADRLWHSVAFMIVLLIFRTVTFVLLAEIS